MALTEEQKEIALRVAKDAFNTESHRAWSYEGGDANVLEFASSFLAALPKPEPVGHYIGEHKDGSDCVYLYRDIKKNQMLYTEAPIAPPASEQKQPWPNHNWCVGCSPDNCSGCGTEPIERRAPQPEQENYKAQRDALLEELEKAAVAFWKLDNADIHAQEAESAIASVKGGAR